MTVKIPLFLTKIKDFFNKIYLPFLGISLWRMFSIYGIGIFKNKILKEAAAISWSFFLSLFPFILFLLSLLPYLPHYEKLQLYIFDILMPNILPGKVLAEVTEYIKLTLLPNLTSLSNFTILLVLIFGINGTHSLVNGFNANSESKISFFKSYLISILVTLAFAALIIISIFGIYYSEVVLKLFTPKYNISWFAENLTKIIGYFSFPLFYFLLLSLFYWVGCIRITSWKQALPGALLTTILFGVVTYLFAFYLAKFSRYNVLYGSIGSIIIVMIWVNLNIILMLLGNELNLTIRKVRMKKIMLDETQKDFAEIRKMQ